MKTASFASHQSASTEAFARRVEVIREQYGSLSAYLHNQKTVARPNRTSRFVRINSRKLAAS